MRWGRRWILTLARRRLTDHQRRALGVAMAELMSQLSERCWCAGWMSGTEHALWLVVDGHTDHWGQCEFHLDDRLIVALRVMRDLSGYWPVYDDLPDVPWEDALRLVPVREWREEMTT